MYAGIDFDPSDPGESELFTLDFVNDIASGDAVNGVLSSTLTVFQGVDASVATRLIGTTTLNGSQVVQRIGNLQPGVIYSWQVIASTNLGNSISLYSRIPCRTAV